jgi:hypothetical protein
MKLFSRLILSCAAVLFLGAGAAKADTAQMLFFDLTGPMDLKVTFELSSNPVIAPGNSDPTCGFVVTPLDLNIDGIASGDFLAFYNNACLGGFAGFPDVDDTDFALVGPQLYQGHSWSPVFWPTSPAGVNMTDGTDDGATYNLTISPVATPEPSSLLLLSMVLLPLAIAAKRFL